MRRDEVLKCSGESPSFSRDFSASSDVPFTICPRFLAMPMARTTRDRARRATASRPPIRQPVIRRPPDAGAKAQVASPAARDRAAEKGERATAPAAQVVRPEAAARALVAQVPRAAAVPQLEPAAPRGQAEATAGVAVPPRQARAGAEARRRVARAARGVQVVRAAADQAAAAVRFAFRRPTVRCARGCAKTVARSAAWTIVATPGP
jgi:hypothetical protein